MSLREHGTVKQRKQTNVHEDGADSGGYGRLAFGVEEARGLGREPARQHPTDRRLAERNAAVRGRESEVTGRHRDVVVHQVLLLLLLFILLFGGVRHVLGADESSIVVAFTEKLKIKIHN